MDKILVTGSSGKLGKEIVNLAENNFILFSPSSSDMNIKNFDQTLSYISMCSPDYVIHSAAMTKPTDLHERQIINSIDTNIIGTANIVKACSILNIKLIYISTDSVYPICSKSSREFDPVLPNDNYGWSKLGGECSVNLYKNSLILRLSFFENPFPFESAPENVFRNVMYVDEIAQMILEVRDQFGIMNIGRSTTKSLYEFGSETNPNLTPTKASDSVSKKTITLDVTRLSFFLNQNQKTK